MPRGGARLLLGGPIAAEIRQAVGEDVAAYRERHDLPGPSSVGIGTGTAIPSLSRCRKSSVSQQRSASLRLPRAAMRLRTLSWLRL